LLEGCPIVAATIASRALIACEEFSSRLRAADVARAIARGLRAGGVQDHEVVLLERSPGGDVGAFLAQPDFDRRMRAARAVVIASPSLHPRTLARSAAFEIATRARQAGVPAYAIAGKSTLSSFDARVLDLQLVLVASTPSSLAAAGKRVAAVL
jgi:glycerate 2-kinase